MSLFSRVSRFVKNHLPTDHISLEGVLHGVVHAAEYIPVVGSVVKGADALGLDDKAIKYLTGRRVARDLIKRAGG